MNIAFIHIRVCLGVKKSIGRSALPYTAIAVYNIEAVESGLQETNTNNVREVIRGPGDRKEDGYSII